ncbi:MAG: ATP-binding cassette domain-containing protein, partial [Aliifodinibius sp.]|nr:ATP-binding cassette domain-containing protein [Fodinibius sp.]NIV13755.1 ATP-binding cassette domain-containing protein [Fodinibius sp.]NIY27537.1 ATP-binding cassette domain-containing protein [Fodinibius sp.]
MIDIKQLNFAYQTTAILEDISLSIAEADFLGMIGPNGAGKSTLLKLVNGLLS